MILNDSQICWLVWPLVLWKQVLLLGFTWIMIVNLNAKSEILHDLQIVFHTAFKMETVSMSMFESFLVSIALQCDTKWCECWMVPRCFASSSTNKACEIGHEHVINLSLNALWTSHFLDNTYTLFMERSALPACFTQGHQQHGTAGSCTDGEHGAQTHQQGPDVPVGRSSPWSNAIQVLWGQTVFPSFPDLRIPPKKADQKQLHSKHRIEVKPHARSDLFWSWMRIWEPSVFW